MKKAIFYFTTLFLTVSVTSCSKDDDNSSSSKVSLVGKWEFSKTGYLDKTIPEEVVVDWGHSCSTKKDYMEFTATESKFKYHFDCNDNSAPDISTYTYADKKITTTEADGSTEVVEVLELTKTTLKIAIDPDSDFTDIMILKRIN